MLFQTRRLRRRRGALFLITLLSKLAILGTSTGLGRSPSCSRNPCAPAPSSQPRRLLTSIYAGAFSSPVLEACGWLLKGGEETLCTNGYCHYLPAVVRWTEAS